MRSLYLILPTFLMLFAFESFAQQGDVWCYAASPSSSERYLEKGKGLENAKNAARSKCAQKHRDCQVTECYESNPYAFTCVATRPCCETRIGGYRAFSHNYNLAKSVAFNNCRRRNNSCVVACYPNFQSQFLLFSIQD
jgi:hypothetical protein